MWGCVSRKVAGGVRATGLGVPALTVARALGTALILTTLGIGLASGQSRSGTIRVSATVPDIAHLRIVGGEAAVASPPVAPALHVTSGGSTEIGIQVDAVGDPAMGHDLPWVLVCPVTAGVARACERHAIPTKVLWSGSERPELLMSLIPNPVTAKVEGTRLRLTVAYTGN